MTSLRTVTTTDLSRIDWVGSEHSSLFRQFCCLVRLEFGNIMSEVILFGSRATKTHRADSDYDVAIFVTGRITPLLERRASDLAFPFVRVGLDIRPVVLGARRRAEQSQFLNHIAESGCLV
jgi:predicted nucleotidyltransferase